MPPKLLLSSYNDQENLHAVFEENNGNAWLYLSVVSKDTKNPSQIVGDVFVCNTVELLENSELEAYKPNLPPITKDFGHPEAVCRHIDAVAWELHWLNNTSILLTKDQKPWALITRTEKRGMCKAIKKSGPWGNSWHEKAYKKLCQ